MNIAMLSNGSLEESGRVRTVKMARRSSAMSSSPSPGVGTPGRRPPYHRTDSSDGSSSDQAWKHIGIVELLEQDNRPTFIVDLGNLASSQSTELQLTYANASLRALVDIFELITGKGIDILPSETDVPQSLEFRAWTFSFVNNYESMDVCLPSFFLAGIVWTCSTIRKRFRIISGTLPVGLTRSNTTPKDSPAIPSQDPTMSTNMTQCPCSRSRATSLLTHDHHILSIILSPEKEEMLVTKPTKVQS